MNDANLERRVMALEKMSGSYLGVPSWSNDVDKADFFTQGADAYMRKYPQGIGLLPVLDALIALCPHRFSFDWCNGAMAAAGIPKEERRVLFDMWHKAALTEAVEKAEAAETARHEQERADRIGLGDVHAQMVAHMQGRGEWSIGTLIFITILIILVSTAIYGAAVAHHMNHPTAEKTP